MEEKKPIDYFKEQFESSGCQIIPNNHVHYDPNRRKKSKTPFIQHMNENLMQMHLYQDLLNKKFGLTPKHWAFIYHLSNYLEWNTNVLVNQKRSNYRYMPNEDLNITDISKILDLSRSYTSSLINKVLIPAGILLEMQVGSKKYVDEEDLEKVGRKKNKRIFLMNPELFCKGGADKINPILFKILKNHDPLEEAGVVLYSKLWHKKGAKYAKLVNRKTYKKYKDRVKDI